MRKEKTFVLRMPESYISIIRECLQYYIDTYQHEHMLFPYFDICAVMDFLPSPCPYNTCQHVDKTCKECLKSCDKACVYDYYNGKLRYTFPYFGISISHEKMLVSWKSV